MPQNLRLTESRPFAPPSPYGALSPFNPDPLLGLMGRIRTDKRPHLIDLGVGMYRDSAGRTPVFDAVKRAEQQLVDQQATKSYLGCEGDVGFVAALSTAVFGAPMAGLQTVGGTGALRLAAEFLARTQSRRRIWLATPTWGNHLPLFTAAGLTVVTVDTWDVNTHTHRPQVLVDAVAAATPGDAVLLHGCCHNPTGIDPAPDYWHAMAERLVARGLVPLVDMAYQGLGMGFADDAAGLNVLAQRVPHLLTAYSCDKNFGLYRERVGALFVRSPTPSHAQLVASHMAALARTQYSMPPDHGAAVVRTILESADLERRWRNELDGMAARLRQLRLRLSARGHAGQIDLSSLAQGRGMFATLPLTAEQVERLQSQHGIYLAPCGRMNIAGLNENAVDRFVAALGAVQRQDAA